MQQALFGSFGFLGGLDFALQRAVGGIGAQPFLIFTDGAVVVAAVVKQVPGCERCLDGPVVLDRRSGFRFLRRGRFHLARLYLETEDYEHALQNLEKIYATNANLPGLAAALGDSNAALK